MKAALVVGGLTIGLISALVVSACDDATTHIFYGQTYDPTADCLDTVVVVDTIGGDDTGQNCAPFCLATEPGPDDAGITVYVSTTCAPYPPLFDTSQTNPLCAPALAAAANQSTCLPDGGRTTDAAADQDAEADAATTDEDSGTTPDDAGITDAGTD